MGAWHVRQSAAVAPEQVAHVASHAPQLVAEAAKWSAGQTARHVPLKSLGACEGHAVHSAADGPSHSAQPSSHARHTPPAA